GAVQEQLEKVRKVLKKPDRSSPEAVAELAAPAQPSMPIKLAPKQYDAPVARTRGVQAAIRARERTIMQLCVRDARMPRADVLRSSPGNGTNEKWVESLLAEKPA